MQRLISRVPCAAWFCSIPSSLKGAVPKVRCPGVLSISRRRRDEQLAQCTAAPPGKPGSVWGGVGGGVALTREPGAGWAGHGCFPGWPCALDSVGTQCFCFLGMARKRWVPIGLTQVSAMLTLPSSAACPDRVRPPPPTLRVPGRPGIRPLLALWVFAALSLSGRHVAVLLWRRRPGSSRGCDIWKAHLALGQWCRGLESRHVWGCEERGTFTVVPEGGRIETSLCLPRCLLPERPMSLVSWCQRGQPRPDPRSPVRPRPPSEPQGRARWSRMPFCRARSRFAGERTAACASRRGRERPRLDVVPSHGTRLRVFRSRMKAALSAASTDGKRRPRHRPASSPARPLSAWSRRIFQTPAWGVIHPADQGVEDVRDPGPSSQAAHPGPAAHPLPEPIRSRLRCSPAGVPRPTAADVGPVIPCVPDQLHRTRFKAQSARRAGPRGPRPGCSSVSSRAFVTATRPRFSAGFLSAPSAQKREKR